MKTTLGFNLSSITNKLAQYRINVASAMGLDTRALKDAQINQHFKIHTPYTYEAPIISDIYNMREAVAGFAKAHNITVDVYNPNEIKGMGNFKIGEPYEFTDKIAVVVTDKNSGNHKVKLFDTNNSRLYPKETVKNFMVNVKGEDTQVIRKVRSSQEDNLLRHIFRSLETMTNNLKNNIK